MIVTEARANVGWVADGYLSGYVQWRAENPRATARQRERVACILLGLADREADRTRPRGRPRMEVNHG